MDLVHAFESPLLGCSLCTLACVSHQARWSCAADQTTMEGVFLELCLEVRRLAWPHSVGGHPKAWGFQRCHNWLEDRRPERRGAKATRFSEDVVRWGCPRNQLHDQGDKLLFCQSHELKRWWAKQGRTLKILNLPAPTSSLPGGNLGEPGHLLNQNSSDIGPLAPNQDASGSKPLRQGRSNQPRTVRASHATGTNPFRGVSLQPGTNAPHAPGQDAASLREVLSGASTVGRRESSGLK